MSYTQLYAVPEAGEIHLYKEYHNAFRGAWLVWENMGWRYLQIDVAASMLDRQRMKEVWDLAQNLNVPVEHRIVLTSTFDNCMVKSQDLPRLIEAFEQYCRDFVHPGHVAAQIRDLRDLAANPDCYAVCWVQTSVGTDAWRVNDGDGWRKYDISRDTGHFFLFDEVEQ